MSRPTHIDLFSGIGGFALAARWCGLETIAFCEKDEYCQKIIKQNFGAVLADDKSNGRVARGTKSTRLKGENGACWSGVAIYPDIRRMDGTRYQGAFLLTGGFPCQPFSAAGKRRGKEDDRFIWPEMLRVIAEAKPRWVLAENVPGIIGMELDNCLSDLEGEGYATGTLVIPACAVDAPHRRDRVWIVANADSSNGHWRTGNVQVGRQRDEGQAQAADNQTGVQWLPEPGLGRVAHGIPNRVDRLKALGNAIVPHVAAQIIRAMIAAGAHPTLA